MLYTGSAQHRIGPAPAISDGEEPSLHFKWWYVARRLHWHHAERKRADNLAKAASSGYPDHSVAKAVQALDKALSLGDIREAYSYLFENFCERAVDEGWIEEVSPCLRLSLKWLRGVRLSLVRSVFLLCEWATCDYRDFRSAPPRELKFTGRKDFSQIQVGPAPDLHRRKRHSRVLKHLPGPFVHDVLEEARVAEGSELLEAMRVYSNERRLLLRRLLCEQYQNSDKSNISLKKLKHHPTVAEKDGASPSSFEQWKNIYPQPSSKVKTEMDVENLKDSISALFATPNMLVIFRDRIG
ncbi:hypothetical protein NC653_032763 [Populus alba x Populus x berolinensis]|uniref:Uncharacterized protein n=1 Tax=Populus alba x Populus x berolinensis TaxID=444605 RepID=A0AAD6PZF8_9ROSI|nr:hypothetical protein NC653_032763 [Populus alba x Populus x berolinensis]